MYPYDTANHIRDTLSLRGLEWVKLPREKSPQPALDASLPFSYLIKRGGILVQTTRSRTKVSQHSNITISASFNKSSLTDIVACVGSHHEVWLVYIRAESVLAGTTPKQCKEVRNAAHGEREPLHTGCTLVMLRYKTETQELVCSLVRLLRGISAFSALPSLHAHRQHAIRSRTKSAQRKLRQMRNPRSGLAVVLNTAPPW